MTAFFCGFVNIRKVFRNSCMSVKTVNNVEKLCIFRRLLGKIGCRSAAEHENIYFVLILFYIIYIYYADAAFCLYALRVTSRKNAHKLHIGSVCYCPFYAFSDVSVSKYSYPDRHTSLLMLDNAKSDDIFLFLFCRHVKIFLSLIFSCSSCRYTWQRQLHGLSFLCRGRFLWPCPTRQTR